MSGSQSAFTGVQNNKYYNRHFGGTDQNIVADPYITGYHFIKWLILPDITEYTNQADGSHRPIASKSNIMQLLDGSCMSVTAPGATLGKTEFPAMGGTKWSVPTTIDIGNSVTIKYLEFSSLPIMNIHHGWVRMIRDAKNGTSILGSSSDEYTKSAYAGTMLYYTTKPDGVTVEYSAVYTGMFPATDAQNLFGSDIASIDKTEIDIEYNVDMVWHETWVHETAQAHADSRKSDVNTLLTSSYGKGRDSSTIL